MHGCLKLGRYTAWKRKYSETSEPRTRDHDSLESWGIQGAHLRWSILNYSARIYPNIRICSVSFIDFSKRTLQHMSSASYWWWQFVHYDEKIENFRLLWALGGGGGRGRWAMQTRMYKCSFCEIYSDSVWNIREIKIHVYAKRFSWICTTWPSFSLNCRVLFITST